MECSSISRSIKSGSAEGRGRPDSFCTSETVLSSQTVWPGVLGSMFGSDFPVTSHKSFNHCTCLFCINRIHLQRGIYPPWRTHGKKVFILKVLRSATHRPSCLIFSPIISYRQLQTIFHPGFSQACDRYFSFGAVCASGLLLVLFNLYVVALFSFQLLLPLLPSQRLIIVWSAQVSCSLEPLLVLTLQHLCLYTAE